MKRFLPILLALVLAVGLFTPAFAAGKGNTPFALVGRVTAIDPATQSVTVQVVSGNALVKLSIGQSVTIKTSTATLFRYTDGTVTRVIKFEDLKIGDAVSAGGTLSGGIWTASRITVGAKLTCLR
jgi:hypothetical protein